MAVNDEDKLWAAIGYISILCLLPLLLKKDRSFVQFHAKQGLVLFIVEVALWIVSMFIGWIAFIWAIFNIVYLGLVILVIIAIVKVIQGESWKIPIVSGYAERIKI
jgi:fumarate reductase subunit D